jgi:transcriptional regulator GlxA family with amidase domain
MPSGARVQLYDENPDVTQAAVTEVIQTAGGVRVDDLAQHINLSRRQLARVMKESVGISPKTFSRIARFNRALQLARTHPRRAWVEVAAEAGYADQAHMVREFTEIGGIRPSDLRGESASTIW